MTIPATSFIPVIALLLVGAVALLAHAGVIDDFLGTINGRGSRVGPQTHVNALGVVPSEPEALAAGAGLDLVTYALARMISSEEGNSPGLEKLAVAFAAWNAHGNGIADALTTGKGDAGGYFKQQGYRYTSGPGKTASASVYASSAQDPHEDDVKIASAVIAGSVADPTVGATNFFRPGLQDQQYAEGKVTRDGATVIAEWTGGGLTQVTVPGIDPGELAFFRKDGVA